MLLLLEIIIAVKYISYAIVDLVKLCTRSILLYHAVETSVIYQSIKSFITIPLAIHSEVSLYLIAMLLW